MNPLIDKEEYAAEEKLLDENKAKGQTFGMVMSIKKPAHTAPDLSTVKQNSSIR